MRLDTKEAIRVVIADDHALVREGARQILEDQPGLAVVGETQDGEEAVDLMCGYSPTELIGMPVERLFGPEGRLRLVDTSPQKPHERLRLVLTRKDGSTALVDAARTVTDNGRGFELRETGHLAELGKLGVLGMRERAQLMGAEFTIESRPGRGTSMRVRMPAGGEKHSDEPG